jgi:two-component system, NarL family, sensor kinase
MLAGFILAAVYAYQERQITVKTSLEALGKKNEEVLINLKLHIQEQTLNDVAKEIHDDIGLLLTLAKLKLNTIELRESDVRHSNVMSATQLLGNAINKLANISRGLNSDAVLNYGLVNSVRYEITTLETATFQDVSFKVSGTEKPLPVNKQIVVFRIVQEALNNAIKHANSTKLSVAFIYQADCLEVFISDDGRGFDERSNSEGQARIHCGLVNMRQRASSIAAVLKIDSKVDVGTNITLTVPFN